MRIARGAKRSRVMSMVLRQAALPAAAGTAIGVAAALGLTQVIKSLLFGIGAMDPVVYLGSALGLLAIALLAAAMPAWRAARVDPLVALRNE